MADSPQILTPEQFRRKYGYLAPTQPQTPITLTPEQFRARYGNVLGKPSNGGDSNGNGLTGKRERIKSAEDLAAGFTQSQAEAPARTNIPPSPFIQEIIDRTGVTKALPEPDSIGEPFFRGYEQALGALGEATQVIVPTLRSLHLPDIPQAIGLQQATGNKSYEESLNAADVDTKNFSDTIKKWAHKNIQAWPATGKYARPAENFLDYLDPVRMYQTVGENAPLMAAFVGATIAHPAAGEALMFAVEGGSANEAMLEYEKKTGKKIPPIYRENIPVIIGAVNAALEKTGLENIFKVGKAAGLKRKLVKAALATIIEGGTEGAQEVTNILAETGYGGQIPADAGQRLVESIYAGLLLGAGGSTISALAGQPDKPSAPPTKTPQAAIPSQPQLATAAPEHPEGRQATLTPSPAPAAPQPVTTGEPVSQPAPPAPVATTVPEVEIEDQVRKTASALKAAKAAQSKVTLAALKEEAPAPVEKSPAPKDIGGGDVATTPEAKDLEAAKVFNVPMAAIATDVDRFQNRDTDFSERTAQEVAENFDPNKFDPIVLWRDPENSKTYVLSGHSRFEGMKRRGEANIPARYFQGDERAAINFARLEANRLGASETFGETLKAYRAAKDQQYTAKQMKSTFGSDVDFLDAVQNLNPSGDFVKILSQPAQTEFPYIRRFARWIGEARETYGDKFTNAHEEQLFKFLYTDDPKNRGINRDDFFKLLDKNFGKADWDASQPLTLRRGELPVTGTRARSDTKEAMAEIDELRERQKVTKTVEEYQALQVEIEKKLQKVAEVVQSQPDLFADIQEELFNYAQNSGERVRADTRDIVKRIDELRKQRRKTTVLADAQKIDAEIDRLNKFKDGIIKTQSDLFADMQEDLFGFAPPAKSEKKKAAPKPIQPVKSADIFAEKPAQPPVASTQAKTAPVTTTPKPAAPKNILQEAAQKVVAAKKQGMTRAQFVEALRALAPKTQIRTSEIDLAVKITDAIAKRWAEWNNSTPEKFYGIFGALSTDEILSINTDNVDEWRKVLAKSAKAEPRISGATSFDPATGLWLIRLFEHSNFSNLVHEIGHVLRRQLPESDVRTIKIWADGENSNLNEPLSKSGEEKFARAWERYLLEGKAPNSALQEIFAKLKQFLGEIYAVIRKPGLFEVEMNDDVRRVMDSLFSGDVEKKPEAPKPNILQQAASAVVAQNTLASDIAKTKFGGTLPDGRKLVAKDIASQSGAQAFAKGKANREVVAYNSGKDAQRFAVIENAAVSVARSKINQPIYMYSYFDLLPSGERLMAKNLTAKEARQRVSPKRNEKIQPYNDAKGSLKYAILRSDLFMTTKSEIEATNVASINRGVEPTGERATTGNQVGERVVPAESGRFREEGQRRVQESTQDLFSSSGGELPESPATLGGKRSDSSPYAEAPGVERRAAGSELSERSGDLGIAGRAVEPVAAAAVERASTKVLGGSEKLAAQARAESVPVKIGDRANIDETLPILKDGQRDDVAFAEARFAQPTGYGVMFTNGTGTGKTFSGLGIIKRMARSGKDNIIIVVPSDKIAFDWIERGNMLKLNIKKLGDTKDNGGRGIVVTTYSNFGQNPSLAKRKWDGIVLDESHYLMQAKQGSSTNALDTLRAISLHPRGTYARTARLHSELFEKLEEFRKRKVAAPQELYDQLQKAEDAMKAEVAAAQGEKRPRVVFLSATPFAYEKAVDYAEGYLFDYPPVDTRARYNQPSGSDQFMVQHFGYRMRYNKLTEPDKNVDRGLMQRGFNTWLKQQKVLSGRRLDVDADYDRRFILSESRLGHAIDEGLQWLWERKRMQPLWEAVHKKFDHLSRRYLLEAIKAHEVIKQIQANLDAGRKVVVFHDFKKGGAFNPFDIQIADDDPATVSYTDEAGKRHNVSVKDLVDEFRAARPDLIDLPIGALPSPLVGLKKAFPNAMIFNGDVPKKERIEIVKKFQDDNSGKDIVIVQAAAGREGISLHDTTGKKPRVLFNLGLPTQPTTAIQEEGRIYREGQASDAMFRYLNTGTNWERFAFAETIAQRSSAAENLALGTEARALLDAFIQAYEESGDYPVGYEGEGKGGKQADKLAESTLTDWDRAIALYYANQKKTSRDKSREGTDYFSTPEPLGQKMVEWANIRPGDAVLEPSAGHGAIARWFPDFTPKTVIEPSAELASRLKMVTPESRLIQDQFENFNIVNKYDAIVMNPPFGVGGKTAIDHLEKAAMHLRDGGRIVAIIPRGRMMDKRFDQWMDGETAQSIYLAANIELPAVTFERAGTKVSSRIVVLDKVVNKDIARKLQPQQNRDYANAETIKEFFDRIENSSVRPRVDAAEIAGEPELPKQPAISLAEATATTQERAEYGYPITEHTTATGKQLRGTIRADISYQTAKSIDPYMFKKNGGFYIREKNFKALADYDKKMGTIESGDVLADIQEDESLTDALAKNEQAPAGRDTFADLEKAEPAPRGEKFQFSDDIEKRWKASHGIKPISIFSKIADLAEKFRNQATREFEHLPRTGEFSRLRFDLQKLQKQKPIASTKAVQRLQEITDKLTPEDYDIFERLVILNDLAHEAEAGHALPFGFTPETLRAEHRRLLAAAASRPAIADAARQRKTIWDDLKADYIAEMSAIGMNVDSRFNKEDYFRHQVLMYANAKGLTGTGKKLRTPANRGFLKQRGGSSYDINSNYLQAEFEVVSQMLYDIEVAKTIASVDRNYNIAPELQDQAKEQKAETGEKVDWHDLIPEGYTTWQPREGSVFYMSDSIPARLAQALHMGEIESLGITKNDLRQVLAVGGPRREFVVKDEVAATLDELLKEPKNNVVGDFSKSVLDKWKAWTLLSPRRAFKYNTRNLVGDADVLFAGNPSAFKKLPQAISELTGHLLRGKTPSAEMERWIERGGMQANLQVTELHEIDKLKEFDKLVEKHGGLTKIPEKVLKGYWNGVRLLTDMRESILRYAAYLDYLDQMKQGGGKPKNFGASIPEEVTALKNVHDKAYKLSNELLGAYDQVSVIGQYIRNHIFPFWSFKEVNFRRYLRLMKNAAQDGRLSEAVGRKLLGTIPKSPYIAMRVGAFAIKATALWSVLQVWNKMFFPDEEDDLPEDTKARPHIIFGRDKDGKVIYFDRLGSLGDFLEWFGLDDAPDKVSDFALGRKTLREIATDMAKAPVNVVAKGIRPEIKLPAELAGGQSYFPDVFKPSVIRDSGLHIARALGIDQEYIAIKKLPSRGYGNSAELMFYYKSDPGETAYYRLYDEKMRFLKKIGKYGEFGGQISAKSNALYNLRLALRYQDKDAVDKYIAEYAALGGDKQGLKTSLRYFHPLNGLGEHEDDFVRQLSADDRDKLKEAMKFYDTALSEKAQVGESLRQLPDRKRKGKNPIPAPVQ